MAKMTIEGVTYEGTPEELAGIVREFTKIQAESKQPNFNEGDRVKTLVDGEFGDIKAGEYGVIDDLDCGGSGDPYEISVETDGNYDYFRPQDLELAPAIAKPDETLKVGDYAVITGEGDRGMFSTHNFEIGEVVKISDGCSYSDRMRAKNLNGTADWAVYNGYMRKATEAEVAAAVAPAKPKTGDIVVITANTNSSRNKVGDIGKVEEISGMNPVVLVPGRKGGRGCTHTKYNEMRLAKPAEIAEYEAALKPKEPALKVGDTVRVEGSGWFKDGTITKVKRLGGWNGNNPGQVLLEGGGNELSIETKYVTKLDEPCAFTKAGRKPNEYRKGDVVRVKYNRPSSANLSEGEVGEITQYDGNESFNVTEKHSCWVDSSQVEIVCFAENRVDAKGVA